jgi:uncharacterized alpha-E superfamily protein
MLERIAQLYGKQGPAQRMVRSMRTRLQNTDIDGIFQSGLHEFLTDFIRENNRLGQAVTEQYLT